MKISEFGITISYPDTWYGEIFRTRYDEITETGPIVHVANTPIILADRSTYAPEARPLLRRGDMILCIVNQPSLPAIVAVEGTERVAPGEPWTIAGASDTPFTGVPSWQSSLRKPIQVAERVFDMIAFFGAPSQDSTLLAALDAVLRSVVIDTAPAVAGDRIEQFFSIESAIETQEWARAALASR